ncbi:helix-turn-helix domain-containing protein [Halosimplex pelagicum]|uniref:Helix-turn-helix domain-containing protein n=1 Tax=Halosimplex pelagicum TaxID=869886 RepID=A0A7D5PE40_9EURY|nr:helix-turn-helix domain-containing protein [Halosimplex pelagicum]QLH81039.1 helix-turn-helix domain-containing protein [Halosimplex pelagicum]
MRYVTVRASPADGAEFHPLRATLADEPAVAAGPVHQLEQIDGETGVSLAEIQRGLDRYSEILAASPYVIDYTTTGSDRGFVYTHFELDDLTRRLLAYRRSSELVVEMPIESGDDGAAVVTLVGEAGAFADAFETVPEEIDLAVVETGEYDPGVRQLFGRLTARQREVLSTAVRAGYYENPREATHDDLAEELDVSPATVGEHLRKIESRVFSGFVAGE